MNAGSAKFPLARNFAVCEGFCMNLATYQQTEGLSLTALAAKLGRPVSTVHGWLNGDRRPSWTAVADIERATAGKVTAADFVPAQSTEAA
jgi:transcriptional regulator with XRE-family HTH domain